MSMTFDLACMDCRKKLWVGQSTRREGTCGFFSYGAYRDAAGNKHLDLFLMEHALHELRFYNDMHDDVPTFEDQTVEAHKIEAVRYPEVEDEDQDGNEELRRLMEHAVEHPDTAQYRVRVRVGSDGGRGPTGTTDARRQGQ